MSSKNSMGLGRKKRSLAHAHVWMAFMFVTIAPVAWFGCSDDNKNPMPQISSSEQIPLPSPCPTPSPSSSPTPSPTPTDPPGRV